MLGMRIMPEYVYDGSDNTLVLTDYLHSDNLPLTTTTTGDTTSTSTSDISGSSSGINTVTAVPAKLSQTFLQHHSLREIQSLQLTLYHTYESQVIYINGVTSGTFILIIEEKVYTTAINIKATGSTIASALRVAASQLINPKCSSFIVTAKFVTTTTLKLVVQFIAENATPIPLLTVYDKSLVGVNINNNVTRIVEHTVLPSGTIDVYFPTEFSTIRATVDYAASAATMKLAIESLRTDILVDVSIIGSANFGYKWIITFLNPRNNGIPSLIIDAAKLAGPAFTYASAVIQKADGRSLWFGSIPAWMTGELL